MHCFQNIPLSVPLNIDKCCSAVGIGSFVVAAKGDGGALLLDVVGATGGDAGRGDSGSGRW